jgi:pimeloyl-ACP methyl ester carboxylesterase
VVFLHGFLESSDMWNYYGKNLPKNIRSICIDLPGHGRSDNFGYVHSMELMAESVRAVLKQENIRKVILVGHSMGGYTALAFAELYPDMIKGVSLYFSSATADNIEKKANRNRAIKLVEKNKSAFIRHSIPFLFTEENRKRYASKITAISKKADRMGVQSIIAALGGMRDRSDSEIVLKFAPFPFSYIIGDMDPVLPADTLIRQSKIPQNCTLVILKKTGHMGFIENKKATFLAVKTFIQSIY